MSERYWITGVQLGLLRQAVQQPKCTIFEKVLNQQHSIFIEIINNQYIGNFPTEKDKKVFKKVIKAWKILEKLEKENF